MTGAPRRTPQLEFGCEQEPTVLRRLLLVDLARRSPAGLREERGAHVPLDRLARDDALLDVIATGQLEHHVHEGVLDDRPQAASAGLTLDRLLGDRTEGALGEDELHLVIRKE